MGQRAWKSIRSKVARDVAAEIGLEEDLIVNEIKTAETWAEAVKRLKAIKRDADVALDIVIRGL